MKRRARLRVALQAGLALVALAWLEVTAAAEPALLELEAKIPLPEVRGRIDHLAVDLARQRLYVAELGNNSVGVIDLKERKYLRTLTGLPQPQGLGYVPSSDSLYVANAGDGSVRIYQGADLVAAGRIDLGEDADNVRVDDGAQRIYVGYGEGALAVIDTTSRRKISELRLDAHPESFQLARAGNRIFVNVPDAGEVTVVYRDASRQNVSWNSRGLRANFPMALDEPNGKLFIVYRRPARLGVIALDTGRLIATRATCDDSDDVFLDAQRARLYVICGSGFVDVFSTRDDYLLREHLTTQAGARTGLFVPVLDRLFVATRTDGTSAASVAVFRPAN
jgi:DNA-binding beta-propeller fold protein YncE